MLILRCNGINGKYFIKHIERAAVLVYVHFSIILYILPNCSFSSFSCLSSRRAFNSSRLLLAPCKYASVKFNYIINI